MDQKKVLIELWCKRLPFQITFLVRLICDRARTRIRKKKWSIRQKEENFLFFEWYRIIFCAVSVSLFLKRILFSSFCMLRICSIFLYHFSLSCRSTCFDKHLFLLLVTQPIFMSGVADFFFPVFLFSPCVLVFLFVHKSLYTMPMLKKIIPYAYLYHLVSCAMRSYTLPSPQVFAQSNLPKWIQRITKCREQSLWLFMCGFAVLQCMCFVHNFIRKSSQIFYLSIYLRWWMSTVLLLVRIILSHFIAYISLCGIFRVWPFFFDLLIFICTSFFFVEGGRANIHCRIPSILICESVSIFIVYTFAFITLLLYG